MTINAQLHSDGSLTFEDFVGSSARLYPGKVIEIPINGPHSAGRFAVVEMHLSDDLTMNIFHAKPIGTFDEARKVADLLWEKCEEAGKAFDVFPTAALGLTPDHVKRSPEFIAAKLKYDAAFISTRLFNEYYVKTWKKEIYKYRAEVRSASQTTGN